MPEQSEEIGLQISELGWRKHQATGYWQGNDLDCLVEQDQLRGRSALRRTCPVSVSVSSRCIMNPGFLQTQAAHAQHRLPPAVAVRSRHLPVTPPVGAGSNDCP